VWISRASSICRFTPVFTKTRLRCVRTVDAATQSVLATCLGHFPSEMRSATAAHPREESLEVLRESQSGGRPQLC
jgi:hypothetical protein